MIKVASTLKPTVITSELFSMYPDVRFGVSTRLGGVSPEPLGMNLSFNVGDDPQNVIENRKRFFDSVGISDDSLAIPRQVHGDTVRRVTEPGRFESCDALLTNVKGIFLTVSIADCVPIFLVDPITKSLAAVHSGWRGSNLSILTKTIIALHNEFGANAENLVAYIGPSATVCCYEVGEDVAKEFDEKYLQKHQSEKSHLDLKRFNKEIGRASCRERV